MRLHVAADFFAISIGDGRVLPDANHVSGSATQKSGSLCVAIACVSVIIMSPSVVYGLPVAFRCVVSTLMSALYSEMCSAASGVGAGDGVSKFISVNIGAGWYDMSLNSGMSDMSMSKSAGKGTVSGVMSVVPLSTGVGCVVGADVGCFGAGMSSIEIFCFARKNADCISAGISDGNAGGGGMSDFVSSGSGAGAGDGVCVGRNIAGIFGVGIVINGFLSRIINVVVAMYSGNAASINIPNTNPANPCNSARIKRCH